jgi:hypothetical protein
MAKDRLEAPLPLVEREGVHQVVLLVVGLLQLAPLVRAEKEVLQVEHGREVALVDPLVLVLLAGGDVPAPVLGVVLVQVVRDETVLLEGVDAGEVGPVLVVVPEGRVGKNPVFF